MTAAEGVCDSGSPEDETAAATQDSPALLELEVIFFLTHFIQYQNDTLITYNLKHSLAKLIQYIH